VEEGRDGHMHGTFINGFHETWPIRHAEEAFGFARVGQTIVNAPDAKVIRLYVDDEPLVITEAEIMAYERRLDFRLGALSRRIEWRTPSGKRVLITSRRMTSFTDRHLGVIDYEVEMLDADAAVTISSQILNRQDGRDEYRSGVTEAPGAFDPRKAEMFTERVLQPRVQRRDEGHYILGYECTNSRMTISVGARHSITTDNDFTETGSIGDDLAKHIYRVRARRGHGHDDGHGGREQLLHHLTHRRLEPARRVELDDDRGRTLACRLLQATLQVPRGQWIDDPVDR
jgi:alpha,alpha-trehalose phosphorylase